jgi:dTDP-4-amino-4,6-dideoxygalactose transaminase
MVIGSLIDEFFQYQFIQNSPVLKLETIFKKKYEDYEKYFPFNQKRISFTLSCSAAIYQALKILRIANGQEILCPAYNCGHEVEPILRSGLKIEFYDVKKNLQINIDDVKKKITNKTRVLLVTHYFGFPQKIKQIRKICDSHGIYLIEDCAHGLYSKAGNINLGTIGDVSVFSPRKTLPLPDGGLLIINNPKLKSELTLNRFPSLFAYKNTFDLVVNSLKIVKTNNGISNKTKFVLITTKAIAIVILLLSKITFWKSSIYYNPNSESFKYNTITLNFEISKLSKKLLQTYNPKAIVNKRRENFRFILKRILSINNIEAIYKELPEGVCPLFFPIIVEKAASVQQEMMRRGYQIIRWWNIFHPDVDWHNLLKAKYLKTKILALPIHQDLNKDRLSKMLKCLSIAVENNEINL